MNKILITPETIGTIFSTPRLCMGLLLLLLLLFNWKYSNIFYNYRNNDISVKMYNLQK